MSWDRACDLCRVIGRADLQERVEVFPLALCCAACAAELREDEAHPRDAEPEHALDSAEHGRSCACGGGGCRMCLDVPGWLG